MLGGGSHADGGVWSDGARASAPTRRWRARAVSMSPRGPGYGLARPCTRSSDLTHDTGSTLVKTRSSITLLAR